MEQTRFNDNPERSADEFIRSLARWLKGGILVLAILLITGILQAFMVGHRQGKISGMVSGSRIQLFEVNRKLDTLLTTDASHTADIKKLEEEVAKLWEAVDAMQSDD